MPIRETHRLEIVLSHMENVELKTYNTMEEEKIDSDCFGSCTKTVFRRLIVRQRFHR